VRHVAQHHIVLVDHHAAGKETKEQGLYDQSENVQEICRPIKAVHASSMSVLRTVVHACDKAKDDQRHAVNAREEGVKVKEQEVFVIPDTNTIVDPWAVMIHLDNASFANTVINRCQLSRENKLSNKHERRTTVNNRQCTYNNKLTCNDAHVEA
jgi:hypothetical protein